MKVALIHPQLILKGGLETRLFNYIRFFHERGDAVTVIASKVDATLPLPEGVQVHKIDQSLVPKPVRLYFFDRALPAVLKKDNYDLIFSLGRTSHQHVTLCPANHLGYLKAMGKKWRDPIDYMKIWLDKSGFRNSRVILAASAMMRDELIRFYHVPAAKIRIAYPPVDTQVFNQSLRKNKAALRKKFGFSEERKTFLFVSTSHDRKNFPLLEKIFSALQQEPVELAVAGFAAETAVPNIKNLGYLRAMQEAYIAADYLIHPALYEPFGQIVSEAVCCGTPVLVSEMTGAKEIVSASEGIVVKGFEVAAWIQAVRELLRSEYIISSDFASEHGLTINQHMDQVIADYK